MDTNEHITQWLEAYHDGELSDRRARRVEAHLESCESCQHELAQLRMLSSLLAEVPLPENLTQLDTFVAQVGLRLPRKPEQTTRQRVLHRGWQVAPVGILGTWVFIQAAFFLTGILMWVLQVIPIDEQFASILPSGTSLFGEAMALQGAGLPEYGRFGLNLIRGGGPFGWGITLNLSLTIIVGLLYLSWLASWWIQKSNGNHKTTISYNGLKGVRHES